MHYVGLLPLQRKLINLQKIPISMNVQIARNCFAVIVTFLFMKLYIPVQDVQVFLKSILIVMESFQTEFYFMSTYFFRITFIIQKLLKIIICLLFLDYFFFFLVSHSFSYNFYFKGFWQCSDTIGFVVYIWFVYSLFK